MALRVWQTRRTRRAWSDTLVASLDERATVLQTSHGDVQVAREGEGPPVLAIHGGPGGFDQGLAYCRHLRDGGCEVIAPSRPGYLRTPLGSGRSFESQADLYAAVLDALDIERAAILGVSSGGPSAVYFAARHPDRTRALFLDAAILMPFKPPISAIQRATLETSFFVWLTYQFASRRPELMTSFAVRGMTAGLTKEQTRAATDWINSDPTRLEGLREQFMSIAPRKHRAPGWNNDKINESGGLAQLPFADIVAPTLIAHGTNESVVPIEHATHAAHQIAGAELILVAEGHHLLSYSRNYGPVCKRQLELAQR
jgi:pimeloyl-ACP methyl ester carboxylesterase